jgi:chromosome segregation protein
LQKDIMQNKQRLARLEKELSVVELESESLEKEIVKLDENKTRSQQNTGEFEKQAEEINRNINALQTEVKSKAQERDAVFQQCTNMKVQLASRKQQEKGLFERLRSLEQAKDKLLQTLSTHQSSASSDTEAEKKIVEDISGQEKLLEELFSDRTKIQGEISKFETQRQKSQVELSQAESIIRENRREIDQINQSKYQLEVTKTQLKMNIDALILKMRERYGVSLENQQNENQEILEEENELEARIEELRGRMENMGSVNLTAIDEYNRQKERYDLMVTQKEDLTKAKDSLYGIIQRINRESRDRLKETYDSVNTSFQELFKRLFGGGHAELTMDTEGDVLESGVDIIAQPPGKKPQSISMLSSGERTLTAIAILFALFRSKPSPFCVLDEVDAALDDANVGRFSAMVKEFSRDTQFIIITHNKRTMEIADVLYGITMEEPGVSKIVSLRMNKGDNVVQAAD